jgi:hypothetical protein
MSAVWSLLLAFISGFGGAWVGAWYQRRSMIEIEKEKTAQRRQAVGVLLQVELASLHQALKEHCRRIDGFSSRAASVGAVKERDYMKWNENRKPYVFRSCIPDIGLLNIETSCQIVYVYNNFESFLQHEGEFISDLPNLINNSSLAQRSKDLSARVTAVMQHIERVIPMLAKQAPEIPFHPKQG